MLNRKEAVYYAAARGNNVALEFFISNEADLDTNSQVFHEVYTVHKSWICLLKAWLNTCLYVCVCVFVFHKGCPLLIATSRGYDKCVAQLLEGGANPSVKDTIGKYNCLMIAIQRKHE